MKLASIAAVAAGGAVGAVLRYMISLLPFRGEFPTATLIVNLLGALVIGFIAGFNASGKYNATAVTFFKTGVCGGFTTFSTFSLEAFGLLEKGRTALGVAYILLSVAGCLLGVWLGIMLGKRLTGN